METQKLKVLAIDDNRENLDAVKHALNRAFPGSVVFTADSGAQGLALARSEDPDAVLLDLIMPGMDGLEVCRRLKADEQLKHIPVVFVAADLSDKETRVKAVEAGADGFLRKPFELEELVSQVRTMAKIKAPGGQAAPESERLYRLDKALSQPGDKSRLLAICSSCKRIRNDKNAWEDVESYIKSNTNITFTHGCCPDCAKRLYPELINGH
ncbi:MAG: hypothetical protein A2X32_02000 [Elusimicrobia bacterium GWC2_64_44]|nr:MAG: hypothetical protein A2X32_02000 [Elusimicrobia bacterium GWC2_64_44]